MFTRNLLILSDVSDEYQELCYQERISVACDYI